MILSATLSKPLPQTESLLGKRYERIKIKLNFSGSGDAEKYFAEFFTKTQTFHKNFSQEELEDFLNKNIGVSFKNCVERTETEEITFLTNKKGKTTRLVKKISSSTTAAPAALKIIRKKNYIIPEGHPVPFLQALGVMTDSGKVVSSKYDKFRQINRFLEFVDDIIPELETKTPLRILDFGSGKSYLTFAIHYYLTEVKKIPCTITGVDLKEDVIQNCSSLAKKLGLANIDFLCGDISDYSKSESPDLVVTLHACDTATDYALNYAVKSGAKAILSVPCCQHEINLQLEKKKPGPENFLEPLLKYGIIRERFSALLTDSVRAKILEDSGYKTQVLEFIDMEGTPKNLLIRAVKKAGENAPNKSGASYKKALEYLGVTQRLSELLSKD